MQIEEYYEQVVHAPQPRRGVVGMMRFMQVLCIVLAVFFFAVFYIFPVGQGPAGWIIGLGVPAVFLALGLLYRWRRRRMLTDYEYIFTNGDLEISRIIANVKRRGLITCDTGVFEALGRLDEEDGKRLSNMPEMKKIDATPDEKPTHYAYFNRNGEKTMLMFSPDEQLFERIRQQNRRARFYHQER